MYNSLIRNDYIILGHQFTILDLFTCLSHGDGAQARETNGEEFIKMVQQMARSCISGKRKWPKTLYPQTNLFFQLNECGKQMTSRASRSSRWFTDRFFAIFVNEKNCNFPSLKNQFLPFHPMLADVKIGIAYILWKISLVCQFNAPKKRCHRVGRWLFSLPSSMASD